MKTSALILMLSVTVIRGTTAPKGSMDVIQHRMLVVATWRRYEGPSMSQDLLQTFKN
jgi:hypothetical protein